MDPDTLHWCYFDLGRWWSPFSFSIDQPIAPASTTPTRNISQGGPVSCAKIWNHLFLLRPWTYLNGIAYNDLVSGRKGNQGILDVEQRVKESHCLQMLPPCHAFCDNREALIPGRTEGRPPGLQLPGI